MKSDKKVRFAVVGLGHIAQAAVLPAFRKGNLPAELTALVSGDPKKREVISKKYKVKKAFKYSEYSNLIKSGEIDAVYICTPNTEHYQYALEALKNNIHVLCEKPLCPTEEECENLIKIADKNNLKLMTAYRLHFDPINLKAVELIKRNAIGKPLIFNSLFSYQIKGKNIRLDKATCGGASWDIGIYCINAARSLFREEPEAVFGSMILGQDSRFTEVEGTANAMLFFSEGKTAIFSSSFATYDKSMYEIVGTKGSIKVEPAYEYAEGLGLELKTEKGKKKFKQKKHDQFAAEIKYFSEAVLKDKKIETDGNEGLADVRILNALHRSAKSGKIIKLSEFKTDYPEPHQKMSYNGADKEDLIHAESANS